MQQICIYHFIPVEYFLFNIFSTGYSASDPNSDLTANEIVFKIAITMLDHTFNTTSPYKVGFTVWERNQDSIEIMWSAQQSVQANSDTLPALVRNFCLE